MGGKDSPDAPDYTGAAEAQGASSERVTNMQTYANRPEINTPWGNINWSTAGTTDPATGQDVTQWTQNLNLDPASQEALDAQQGIQAGRSELAGGLLDRAVDEFGQPIEFGQTPLAATPEARSYGDPESYRGDVEDALYGRSTSRLDPRFAHARELKESQLRNQGLTEGDEAYDYAMARFGETENDAYQQAQFGATIGAGAEASRDFGMDITRGGQEFGQEMGAAGYQNTLRQQEITEEMTRRGYSLNEINAILTGQQVQQPGMPGFTNANRSEATQYLPAAQAQYGSQLDQFNAEQAGLQGILSGATGLAGGAAPYFGF